MKSEEKMVLGSHMPNYAIDEWKAKGGKVVGTICCHVPEEIIHAADMLPVRLRGNGCTADSQAEVWMSSFSCSFVRACLEQLLDGTYSFMDGVVSSDGCQMAQRLFDNWNHTDTKTYKQLLIAPRKYRAESASFYREELGKFKKGMETLSGIAITDEKLKESTRLYNETRRLIKELYDLRKCDAPVITGTESLRWILAAMSMPKDEYNELLSAFLKEAKERAPLNNIRARLMIIGSALDDPEFLKIIEDQGGLIVTDTQCFGTRYLWEPVELTDEDALTSLAEAYLSRPSCPRMCNLHNELYDFIMDMKNDFKVDGIIFVKLKNCDTWGGESLYIQDKLKASNIPVLTLEREQIMTNAGQVAVRAEAFIEMIEEGK